MYPLHYQIETTGPLLVEGKAAANSVITRALNQSRDISPLELRAHPTVVGDLSFDESDVVDRGPTHPGSALP
jgi:hypothetical protein